MLFSISADSLIKRTLWLGKKKVALASLFPFFDLEGSVEQLMLILQTSDQVYVIPRDDSLIRIDIWGDLHLLIEWESLNSFSRFHPGTLKGLYHFDPLWMLEEKRFNSHWALKLLKDSNCVHRFVKPAVFASYSRNLSTLKKLIIESGSLNLSFRSVKLDQMKKLTSSEADQSPQKRQPLYTSTWRLDPIWEKETPFF